MNGATEIQSYEPIPSGVVVHTTGTNFIRHNDWLGTSRFASTYPGRTMYFDAGYGPFGEQYASSGTTDLSFTGQTQDVTSLNGGLYDFPARKYSPVQVRFVSPDLGGSPSVVNPQSWNMYAYVLNNPMSLVDPTG